MNYEYFKYIVNKHNAELQRTAPGTKDLGAFSLKRHKHFFLNIYVCALCSSGIDRHESENKVVFFFFPKFGFGANGQEGRVHMQGILLTRHCQVEVISILKENPTEEEQVES